MWVTFCTDFDEQNTILEVLPPLCAGMAQSLETSVQKNHFGAKGVTLLRDIFRVFRHFVTFDFSFIFDLTSDSELCALWWPKGAHEEVFGDPFSKRFRG